MLAFVIGLMMVAFDPAILTVPVVHAQEVKVWTQEEVRELAVEQAKKYGLNTKRFLAVLACENNFNATGQSEHITKSGEREDSWGSAQINLYWNPEVTQAQAEDPLYAISWMAERWSIGKHRLWSCFGILESKGWGNPAP